MRYCMTVKFTECQEDGTVLSGQLEYEGEAEYNMETGTFIIPNDFRQRFPSAEVTTCNVDISDYL